MIHLARRNLLLGVESAIVVEEETWRAVVEPLLDSSPWLSQAITQQKSAEDPGVCLVASRARRRGARARAPTRPAPPSV